MYHGESGRERGANCSLNAAQRARAQSRAISALRPSLANSENSTGTHEDTAARKPPIFPYDPDADSVRGSRSSCASPTCVRHAVVAAYTRSTRPILRGSGGARLAAFLTATLRAGRRPEEKSQLVTVVASAASGLVSISIQWQPLAISIRVESRSWFHTRHTRFFAILPGYVRACVRACGALRAYGACTRTYICT